MSNIKIGRMVLSVCSTNCYFLYREDATEVVVIDAPDQGALIAQRLKEHGFSVAGILLTHGHFDHIWGASELRAKTGAKIYAAAEEEKLLGDAYLNVSTQAGRPATVKANHLLQDGEELTLADITFKMILTPGHTAGSCCYYIEEAGILMAGDTLFCESVGRTDFPTGSGATLERSCKEKLFVLPEDTRVYPGHGDDTTIGHEMKYNPFLV